MSSAGYLQVLHIISYETERLCVGNDAWHCNMVEVSKNVCKSTRSLLLCREGADTGLPEALDGYISLADPYPGTPKSAHSCLQSRL
jgi:hypothetical protein